MKILALDLIAFGPFTDTTLDLSGGAEGLHLVYGDNAFGKSTTLRAITGLLYGIPTRTGDDHVHGKKDLRIGARLRGSDGAELSFVRRKGRKSTVLDDDGAPLTEDALEPFLGGVQVERFMESVGIDHERLVRGGRQILEGQGDVGEIVLEAGLGGARMRRVRDQLQKEADALFAPNAPTRQINRGVRVWTDATRRQREATLAPDDWRSKDHRRAQCVDRRGRLVEERARLEVDAAKMKRLERTMPKVAHLERLYQERAAAEHVPLLAVDAAERRKDALRSLGDARVRAKSQKVQIEQLRNDARALDVPLAVLDAAEAIHRLNRGLDAYRRNVEERPTLVLKLEHEEAAARRQLVELSPSWSLDDCERMRPRRSTRARVDELASRYVKIDSAIDRFTDELVAARSRAEGLEAQFREMGEREDPAALKAVLRRIERDGDLEDRRSTLEQSRLQLEEEAEVARRGLSLWSGSLVALSELAVPSVQTVDRFEVDLDAHATRLERVERGRDELIAVRAELDAAKGEMERAGSVPMEAGLLHARARRDRAWAKLLKAGLTDVAVVRGYEDSRQQADDLADRLRREADRVARAATLTAQIDDNGRKLPAARENVAAAKERLTEVRRRWADAWAPCGITPLSPREMRGWLDGRSRLCAAAAQIRERRHELERIDQRIAQHRQALAGALGPADPDSVLMQDSLRALIDRVAVEVEARERHARSRRTIVEALPSAHGQVEEKTNKLAVARDDMARWETAWAQSVVQLGLACGSSVVQVRAYLEGFDQLVARLDERARITGRIAQVQAEIDRFERHALELASALADAGAYAMPAQIDADASAVELQARLSTATQNRARRDGLEQHIADYERALVEATAVIERQEKLLEALRAEAGAANDAELERAEARSDHRRATEAAVRGLEDQLIELGDGGALAEIITEAKGADRAAMAEAGGRIEDRLADIKRDLSKLDNDIGRLDVQLEAMDGRADAATAAEDAAAAAAHVSAGLDRFVRARIAASLLRRHMDSYRQRHEGPVLRRASEFFAHFTLAQFRGLETAVAEDGRPVIYGLRASGRRVEANGMSEGTRDQLFLALRLAALLEQLDGEGQEPLPFIVDDVLVGFDDARAEAALEVLGDVSDRTQVIFFTHHDHLARIASRAVGSGQYFEHRLPRPQL